MTKTRYTPSPLRHIYSCILPLCPISVKAICIKKGQISHSAHAAPDHWSSASRDSTEELCAPSTQPAYGRRSAPEQVHGTTLIPLIGYLLRNTRSPKKERANARVPCSPSSREMLNEIQQQYQSNGDVLTRGLGDADRGSRAASDAAQSRDCMGGNGLWSPAGPLASLTKRRSIAILLLTFTLR